MFGAIIGDIIGSRFEFDNCKPMEFELFTNTCDYTDDTVMTLAVAKHCCPMRQSPIWMPSSGSLSG